WDGPARRRRQFTFLRVDPYFFHTPIGHARAIKPLIEELLPRLAGIRLEFALKIGDTQNPEMVARVNQSHEVDEGGRAERSLDHAGDPAAAVVAHAGQVDEVAILRHLLNRRTCLASADRAVKAI